MSFFDDIGDVFEDAGRVLTDTGEVVADIVTFGGISKKKAGKANASALTRAAELNAEVLEQDAETVIAIARQNADLALKDAEAVRSIGRLNADAFRADAEAATEASQMEAENLGLVQGRQVGQQRASIGASGVRMQGSPLIALQESARIGRRNIRNVLRTGHIRAARSLSKAKITDMEASERFRRFQDEAEIILETSFANADKLKKRADITRETGQAAAGVQLLQGKSALTSGIGQGISTAFTLFV